SITIDEAKAIALAKVEGANDSNIVIHQDRDDGKDIYEGTIVYNGTEYEFEIDAATGNVTSWEEDRHN
ncbi:MAG: PepSY domain-containing protein, partial [Bacillota bacterium]|nr:PepSY domain-containing protein [Bacillota bacterium]